MLDYLAFSKPPDSPVIIMGCHVEFSISSAASIFANSVPVVTVGLNDEPNILKDKVGLESPKQRLVHLELQPPLLELSKQGLLDGCHFGRKALSQACLSYLLSCVGRPIRNSPMPLLTDDWVSPGSLTGLTYFLKDGLRKLASFVCLSYFCTRLARVMPACKILVAEERLAYFFSCFRANLAPQVPLAAFLDSFRGWLSSQECLTYLSPYFRRSLVFTAEGAPHSPIIAGTQRMAQVQGMAQ